MASNPRECLRFGRSALERVSLRRLLSVKVLEDETALDKFRADNPKSVLYFTAQWCGPCRQIKPIYEEMSKKYENIAFGKVDIDENADAAMSFEISAVPTFVLFDGKDQVDRMAGADPVRLDGMLKSLEDP